MVLCAVKRDNVIFAVTHHGGHLGYFEGGFVLPNSVTWLDRVVVDFSTALLCCEMADGLQEHKMCVTSNSHDICEPSTNKSPLEDDDDDYIIKQQQHNIQRSPSPTPASTEADTESKLAAKMVANILRVSASVVYNDTSSVLPHGRPGLASSDDVVVMKSANINHSPM